MADEAAETDHIKDGCLRNCSIWQIPIYHTKILLRDFNKKVIFKLTVVSENFYEISNDNELQVINFAKTSKLLHKHRWNMPDYTRTAL
jgi:hypothetical protein